MQSTGEVRRLKHQWRALTLDDRDPAIPFEEIVSLIDLSGSAYRCRLQPE